MFKSLWTGLDGKWERLAFVGPVGSLKPEPRKNVSTIDKRIIFKRQDKRCRFCSKEIQIEPYANADVDHIVPISLGGKTVNLNLQLLCVSCHRHKTALENQCDTDFIHVPWLLTYPGEVHIVHGDRSEFKRPMNSVTPLELDSRSQESRILSYLPKKRNVIPHEFLGKFNIFDRFRYVPSREK